MTNNSDGCGLLLGAIVLIGLAVLAYSRSEYATPEQEATTADVVDERTATLTARVEELEEELDEERQRTGEALERVEVLEERLDALEYR
jgi:hypothetical protein